jgi:hypothetical protein
MGVTSPCPSAAARSDENGFLGPPVFGFSATPCRSDLRVMASGSTIGRTKTTAFQHSNAAQYRRGAQNCLKNIP